MKFEDIFPCLKKAQPSGLNLPNCDGESLVSEDSQPDEALLQDCEYKQLNKIHNYYLNHGNRRRSSVTPTVAPVAENDLEELAADAEYEPKKSANMMTTQEKFQIQRRLSTQLARRQSTASQSTRMSSDTLDGAELKRSRRNSIITKSGTLGELTSMVSQEHSLPSRSLVSRMSTNNRRSSVILPPSKQRRPSACSIDLAFTEPKKRVVSPTESRESLHHSIARSGKSRSVSLFSLTNIDRMPGGSNSGIESLAKTTEKVRETCGDVINRTSQTRSRLSTDVSLFATSSIMPEGSSQSFIRHSTGSSQLGRKSIEA